jgi:hypothetical protein
VWSPFVADQPADDGPAHEMPSCSALARSDRCWSAEEERGTRLLRMITEFFAAHPAARASLARFAYRDGANPLPTTTANHPVQDAWAALLITSTT